MKTCSTLIKLQYYNSKQSMEVEQSYLCPITREIMLEPVVASDGYTYEEDALVEHIKTSRLSPMTRVVLETKYYKNQLIKNKIEELLDQNPELKPNRYVNYKFKNNKETIMSILCANPVNFNTLQSYHHFDLTDVDLFEYLKSNIIIASLDTLQIILSNTIKLGTSAYKNNLKELQRIVLRQGNIDTINILFSKLIINQNVYSFENILLQDHNPTALDRQEFINCLNENNALNREDNQVLECLNNIARSLYQKTWLQLNAETTSTSTVT